MSPYAGGATSSPEVGRWVCSGMSTFSFTSWTLEAEEVGTDSAAGNGDTHVSGAGDCASRSSAREDVRRRNRKLGRCGREGRESVGRLSGMAGGCAALDEF